MAAGAAMFRVEGDERAALDSLVVRFEAAVPHRGKSEQLLVGEFDQNGILLPVLPVPLIKHGMCPMYVRSLWCMLSSADHPSSPNRQGWLRDPAAGVQIALFTKY